MAAAGESKVYLCDDAFKEFSEREDLPQFDFICLHGIWSWVNKENQGYIVDFIAKHLKVGGVLYISYNVSPGFMAFEPVRHLMYQFNERQLSTKLDSKQRIWNIGMFMQQLLQTGPAILSSNPNLANRIQDTFNKDPHYIIGEYLNDTWDIIHFSDMVEALDRAKLNFACSATGSEHLEHLSLTKVQQKFLSQLNDTIMYESCRDFMVFQQFRRDFFVKGGVQISPEDRVSAIDNLHLVLTSQVNQIDFKKKDVNGDVIYAPALYMPVFEYLSDYKVHKIGDAIHDLMDMSQRAQQDVHLSSIPSNELSKEQLILLYSKHFTEAKLREALCNIVLLGDAAPAVPNPDDECIARCKKLNYEILTNPLFASVNFLVSPITQGGIFVQVLNFKLLGLYLKHHDAPEDLFVEELLKESKKIHLNIKRNNRPVTNLDEKKEVLKGAYQHFIEYDLPRLKNLLLCDFED